MKNKRRRKKKCIFCQNPVESEPEAKSQYVCGRKKCQKERIKHNSRKWRKENPRFQASHRLDDEYRKTHRMWKKEYRKRHPEYVAKNAIYVKKHRSKVSPSYRAFENSEAITQDYKP